MKERPDVLDDLPGVGAQDVGISLPEWRDLQSSGIFQFVSIHAFASVKPHRQCTARAYLLQGCHADYFAVLGVDAQLGRTFDPHDATPGFNLEVVISDGLWRRESSCRSVPIKSTRLISHAGASPRMVPAATGTATANASTPQLIDMSLRCGRLSGTNCSRNFLVKFRPNTSTCWA
jgi:hypothetical protein